MTTLIYAEGAVNGRCDAKCYDATSADCNCICGGKNHGVGYHVAVDYTRDMAEHQIRAIEAKGGYVAPEFRQQLLFGT